jgi:hypothetical protein
MYQRVNEFLKCDHCNIAGYADTSDVSLGIDKIGSKKTVRERIEWVIRKRLCSHCYRYTFSLLSFKLHSSTADGLVPLQRELLSDKQIQP